MLTQYKSHSLDRHITTTWRMSSCSATTSPRCPAQQRLGPRWYTGSADAILQSLNLVYDEKPDYLVVFGADHVYRMDPSQMVAEHIETGAEATVAGIRVPRARGQRVRRIKADADGSRSPSSWRSRPTRRRCPDDPDVAYASMGNYVFTTEALIEALRTDAEDDDSVHDMGGNIIPMLVEPGRRRTSTTSPTTSCPARPTATAATGATSAPSTPTTTRTWTWSRCSRSSTSTTDAGRSAPRRPPLPPAKFVEDGTARDSMIGAGTIISGATVTGVGGRPDVRIGAGAGSRAR